MTCYPCTSQGTDTEASAVCTHCGAALCASHFREARAYKPGGMGAYACPHTPSKTTTGGLRVKRPSRARPQTSAAAATRRLTLGASPA